MSSKVSSKSDHFRFTIYVFEIRTPCCPVLCLSAWPRHGRRVDRCLGSWDPGRPWRGVGGAWQRLQSRACCKCNVKPKSRTHFGVWHYIPKSHINYLLISSLFFQLLCGDTHAHMHTDTDTQTHGRKSTEIMHCFASIASSTRRNDGVGPYKNIHSSRETPCGNG